MQVHQLDVFTFHLVANILNCAQEPYCGVVRNYLILCSWPVMSFLFQAKCSISERHKGLPTKKESERRPRSLATHRRRLENFVGEEAPEARVGPATGEAGEEAGAVPKNPER